LWPVPATTVPSAAQVLGLNSSVSHQRVTCCLVQGAQLGCARSRHSAGKFLHIKSFQGTRAELRFLNLQARGFVGKIDVNLNVKSAFSVERLIEAIESVGRRHQNESADCAIVVKGALHFAFHGYGWGCVTD
jgi:hypothetical protein